MTRFCITLGAVLWLAASLAAARGSDDKPVIVLVHGAFETADVWKPVEAQLRHDGYATLAVNLPGRPGSSLAPDKATLDGYRDEVLAKISAAERPVVLVGHSFGGMTISAVAEAAPEKIASLVYVAAYLPINGQSLVALSQTDKDSQMGPAFRVADDKTSASVDPAARADLFCNGCPPKQAKRVADSIVAEPLGPLATPVTLTDARFGSVRKVYIHTSDDRVVSPALQASMASAAHVAREITVHSGHAPFAAVPVELAKAIEAAAK